MVRSIVPAVNTMASYWYWNLLYLLCAMYAGCWVPTRAGECVVERLNCSLENVNTTHLIATLPVLPKFPCSNCTASLDCCAEEPTTTVVSTTTTDISTTTTDISTTTTDISTTTSTTETPSTSTSTSASTTPGNLTTPSSTDGQTIASSTTGKLTTSDIPATSNMPTPRILVTGTSTISATMSSAGRGSPSDGRTADLKLSTRSTAAQPMGSASPDHSLAFTEASSPLALTSPVYNTTTQEITNDTTGENATTTTTTPASPPGTTTPGPPGSNDTLRIVIIVVVVLVCVAFLICLIIVLLKYFHWRPNRVHLGKNEIPIEQVTSAAAELAGNGTNGDKRPLSSAQSGPDKHNVENEDGRRRAFSTGSQACDTTVLIKEVPVGEAKM